MKLINTRLLGAFAVATLPVGFTAACNSLTGISDLTVTEPSSDASLEATTDSLASDVGTDTQDASADDTAADTKSPDAGEDSSPTTDVAVDSSTPDSSGDSSPADSSVEDSSADSSPADAPGDVVTEQTAVCQPIGSNPADLWVDAKADANGTGSENCPLSTVTKALKLFVSSSAKTRTVHVAAGTYNAAKGESFPLAVSFPVAIQGAGPSLTHISGIGAFKPTSGNYSGRTIYTPVAVSSAGVTIDGLSLEYDSSRTENYVGLLCIKGNANSINSTFPSGQGANINNVTIRGFDVGMAISASGGSGCNARVTASTFDDNNKGIFVAACGLGGQAPDNVSARIGDGTDAGRNSFTNNTRNDGGEGSGVLIWDCASPVIINNNKFSHNDWGVDIDYHSETSEARDVEILTNTFDTNSLGGIDIGNHASVGSIESNKFIGQHGNGNAAGLKFKGTSPCPSGDSHVCSSAARVRSNSFIGNDIGVWFSKVSQASDFGSQSDPGNNIFSCNSNSDTGTGADILLQGTSVAIPMLGNTWDHSPPNMSTSSNPGDGTDLVESASTAPSLDSQNQTAGTCPTGYVP